MADGAELSLDDYIKNKKKQGGFKVEKKNVVGKNASKKQKGRGGGRGGGGQPRGNNQQSRNSNRSNNQGQGQQNRRNFQRGGNRFSNNRTPNQVQFQTRRTKNRRSQGSRVNVGQQNRAVSQGNQRVGGGISQHVVATNRQVGRRGNRQGTREVPRRGFFTGQPAQPLMGRLDNIKSTGVPRRGFFTGQPAQPLMGRLDNIKSTGVRRGPNNVQRGSNKRVVVKLAKKRIQRAKLQLAKRNVPVPTRTLGSLTARSRVRLGRNGLVTVRDPAEKQLQRLIIQTKIQRAQAARNKGRFPNSPYPRGNNKAGAQNARRQPNRRPRFVHQVQQQQAINRMVPSMMFADEYDPFKPQLMPNTTARGGTMYADLENDLRGAGMASGSHWSPPIVRTAHNNNYRPSGTDFDSSLNPEIQRKISFIQSRNRVTHPPEIIPDFRAPIVTSTMKLGDRFKMYMQ